MQLPDDQSLQATESSVERPLRIIRRSIIFWDLVKGEVDAEDVPRLIAHLKGHVSGNDMMSLTDVVVVTSEDDLPSMAAGPFSLVKAAVYVNSSRLDTQTLWDQGATWLAFDTRDTEFDRARVVKCMRLALKASWHFAVLIKGQVQEMGSGEATLQVHLLMECLQQAVQKHRQESDDGDVAIEPQLSHIVVAFDPGQLSFAEADRQVAWLKMRVWRAIRDNRPESKNRVRLVLFLPVAKPPIKTDLKNTMAPDGFWVQRPSALNPDMVVNTFEAIQESSFIEEPVAEPSSKRPRLDCMVAFRGCRGSRESECAFGHRAFCSPCKAFMTEDGFTKCPVCLNTSTFQSLDDEQDTIANTLGSTDPPLLVTPPRAQRRIREALETDEGDERVPSAASSALASSEIVISP